MKKKNNLPYVGYVASLLGGNFITPLIGIGTKGLQDTKIAKESKTVDYVRAGALVATSLDCLLTASGIIPNSHDVWAVAVDIITITSLYSDLNNYSQMENPIKETYDDFRYALKNWYHSYRKPKDNNLSGI